MDEQSKTVVQRYLKALDEMRAWSPARNLQVKGAARTAKVKKVKQDLREAEEALRSLVPKTV